MDHSYPGHVRLYWERFAVFFDFSLVAVRVLALIMSIGAEFHMFAAFLEKHSLAAWNFTSWFHFLVVLGLNSLSLTT